MNLIIGTSFEFIMKSSSTVFKLGVMYVGTMRMVGTIYSGAKSITSTVEYVKSPDSFACGIYLDSK